MSFLASMGTHGTNRKQAVSGEWSQRNWILGSSSQDMATVLLCLFDWLVGWLVRWFGFCLILLLLLCWDEFSVSLSFGCLLLDIILCFTKNLRSLRMRSEKETVKGYNSAIKIREKFTEGPITWSYLVLQCIATRFYTSSRPESIGTSHQMHWPLPSAVGTQLSQMS